jgi:hypothetical protein
MATLVMIYFVMDSLWDQSFMITNLNCCVTSKRKKPSEGAAAHHAPNQQIFGVKARLHDGQTFKVSACC